MSRTMPPGSPNRVLTPARCSPSMTISAPVLISFALFLLRSNDQYTWLQQKTHCEIRSGFGVSQMAGESPAAHRRAQDNEQHFQHRCERRTAVCLAECVGCRMTHRGQSLASGGDLSIAISFAILAPGLALTGEVGMVDFCAFRRVKHYEDDVSAVAQETGSQTWIYGAYGDAQWTQGAVCATSEGTRTPDGVKGASPKGSAVDDAETTSRERAPDLGLSRAQRIRFGALFQDA